MTVPHTGQAEPYGLLLVDPGYSPDTFSFEAVLSDGARQMLLFCNLVPAWQR